MATTTKKKTVRAKNVQKAARGSVSAATVELHYYEFCESSLGVWDREWDLDRERLEQARNKRLQDHGKSDDDEEDEEMGGDVGDIEKIQSTVVSLTPEGILAFAQNFAVDSGEG